MRKAKDVLEFIKIQQFISDLCKTERAKKEAFNISLFENKEALEKHFSILKDVDASIRCKGNFPIEFSIDLLPKIDHAIKGGILTIDDLDHVAMDVITSLTTFRFINSLPSNLFQLKELNKSFYDLSNLEKAIHIVITKSLTIDDHASNELYDIRRKIATKERQLEKEINEAIIRHKEFLNDYSSTIRDGHFVLPVKCSDKNKVKGIVHDISDTKQTIFIEPEEIVSLNNEIITLQLNERDEIKKILAQLTNLVIIDKDHIINNNILISKLDLYNAIILYGNNTDSIFANISPTLKLISARHPLINKNDIIPNTFILNDNKRIVLISGPNAGGKTICLKTVGLLSYMFLSGLMVPAREAEIPFYKNIYLDIGDSQSISDSLSTFSAHISSISQIINLAKGNDLVLIDELGTGTDPKEGEALALAIIKEFERKNTTCFISSHFSYLKKYALESKKIVNGSMIFDEEKLLPTYRFKSGLPGESYALEVAYRYGIKKEIIEEAKNHLRNENEINIEEIEKHLRKTTLELERQREELNKEKKDFLDREKELKVEYKKLKESKDRLLEEVKEEKKRIIDSAINDVDSLLASIKKEDIKPQDLKKIKSSLIDLYDVDEEMNKTFNDDIKINDYVIIPSLDVKGYVVSISGNNIFVKSGAFNVKVNKNKAHIIEKEIEEEPSKKERVITFTLPNVKPELNIIGKTVLESKDEVRIYIENAISCGLSSVRIIHGFGSGKLRRMVEEIVSKHNKVKTYRLGGIGEGGGGATIVFFKNEKKN